MLDSDRFGDVPMHKKFCRGFQIRKTGSQKVAKEAKKKERRRTLIWNRGSFSAAGPQKKA
jgi:hypothetical protein